MIAGESVNISLWPTASSPTLYPKNSFIQIARHRRSSLNGRGIFDSGRSLQVEVILLNISHTTFRHCRERSYASVGQPFPKQMYFEITLSLLKLPNVEIGGKRLIFHPTFAKTKKRCRMVVEAKFKGF